MRIIGEMTCFIKIALLHIQTVDFYTFMFNRTVRSTKIENKMRFHYYFIFTYKSI